MISDAHRRAVAGLAIAVVVGLGACASEPSTPAEIRRARVEARLQDSFTGAQASCILDDLDPATIRALAGSTDLAASATASSQYSDAVVRCVTGAGGAGGTTTTTPPATTTTKP